MAEKAVWDALSKAFSSEGDWIRVENPARPGTPDVNFAWKPPGSEVAVREGWIELKQMVSFPRDYERTIFRIPHYTQQQRVWIARRSRAGGHVWMLLQVEKPCTYILIPGPFCSRVGDITAAELERYSAVWSPGRIFPKAEIGEELRNGAFHRRNPAPPRTAHGPLEV